MTRKDLEVLAEKYQKKADTAYRNFQETGISRYDNERRKNEDLAEAMRMAAAASDDHHALVHLRGSMANLAAEAKRIEYIPEDQKLVVLEALRKRVLVYATLSGVAHDLS